MEKKAKQTKDNWDKADIVIKGIAGFLITGAITLYSVNNTSRQIQIAESNRQAQILVQTMNHRESSAALMRVQMFKTLMEHYFQKNIAGDNNDKSKITILELIGLNFQDHIHLKPLFKELDIKLTTEGKAVEKGMLINVAKLITKSETRKIAGSGGDVFDVKLKKKFPAEWADNETKTMDPSMLINLNLLEVNEYSIKVSTDPKDKEGFEVSYYDTPLMDNSRIGELTYSILLHKTFPKINEAEIKVVILPEHFYSALNTLRFDALIGDILDP